MRLFLLSLCVLVTFASSALADPVPDPSLSTVEAEAPDAPCPEIAVVCPSGDIVGAVVVTVTVIDMYGEPVPGRMVDCEAMWAAPDVFCFCPGENPQQYPTDGDGVVRFTFKDLGGCGDLWFSAECMYVPLGTSPPIYVSSPDHNGDCVVDLVDFGYFGSNYLAVNQCSDYNCDGIVDLVDFGTFAFHYLHMCQ